MSSRGLNDRGSVTAEFAVVFPALILTIGLLFSGVQLAFTQIEMQRLAALAARELARGGALGNLESIRPNFAISSFEQGKLLCVLVRSTSSELEEKSCAFKEAG